MSWQSSRRKHWPNTAPGALSRSRRCARAPASAFKAFEALPQSIQRKARDAYARWSDNPAHPSLRFKKIHDNLPIWFWIGSHADYDDLVSRLRKL